MTAVVLLSGGLDSTVCMGMASKEHDSLVALSVRYGQRHSAELDSAAAVAAHYGAEHVVLDLDPRPFAAGSLTTDEAMPHATYAELEAIDGPSPTYVPFRNGTLLSLATATAVTRGASHVYAGMHAEDARGWAYPDCTPEFIGAMAGAIYVGTYHAVRLVTPLEWMSKTDVVRAGVALNVPFDLTLSCYEGKKPACGECPTCVERAHAFAEVGMKDPVA